MNRRSRFACPDRVGSPLAVGVSFALACLLEPSKGWAATEVNTCGQVLSGAGFLSGDLDCTGFAGDAITIDRGKLDLQGFTLTGGIGQVIECAQSCAVVSDPPGGLITGGAGSGITGYSPGTRINIKTCGVTITGNAGYGVEAGDGSISLRKPLVTNNARDGVVSSQRPVRLRDSVVSGNGGAGVIGFPVKVRDSEVNANGEKGVSGSNIRIKDSTVSGNGTNSYRLRRSW